MIDELRLNTKLIGFDGIIGRRDYFLNIIYICMINIFFTLPLTWYLTANVETLTDFINLNRIFYNAPFLLKFWTIAGTVLVSYISVSNIIRRLNDINGKINRNLNIIIPALSVLTAFGILFPTGISLLLLTISGIIGLILLFMKGKITGNYPYDMLKDFNWGAFFGTWLWGLFNKSYKTLWMLLLGLTPWGFYYKLVCGLKGNEWAYKNKKWESDKKFISSQETQTIVFVILSVVIVPVIWTILIMTLVFGIVFTAIDESKTSPNQTPPVIEKLGSALNNYSSLFFEGHTITKTENKFYVLPNDWKTSTFSEKKDLLDMAATVAAGERKPSSTKSKELPRTKIYSSTNGELLGEFVIDESVNESDDIKTIIKAAINAYRFYKPTEQ